MLPAEPAFKSPLTGKETRPTVCTGCGCLCDDIDLTLRDGKLAHASNLCALGKTWLNRPSADESQIARMDGKEATLEDAIDKAADLLLAARHPLVFGLEELTCQAACKAVAIADWLGASLDTTSSVNQGPVGLAFQGVGEISCSLGEVKNRADLILFWGTDPVRDLPRHTQRYSLYPPGIHLPGGRRDRFVVVIDSATNDTSAEADQVIRPAKGRDFEILWTLRALVQGVPVYHYDDTKNGVCLTILQDLAVRLKGCRFGVLFFGQGLTRGGSPGRHLNADAAVALALDLNAFTRFYARPMRGPGNPTGADSVACWQTGYPFGVNFSRKYPRFGPGEFTATELLSQSEVDAALIVAADPAAFLPGPALDHLARIPSVVIGSCPSMAENSAEVVIRTAPLATGVAGTVYRMDDISLPLRVTIPSALPSDEAVLTLLELALLARINGQKGAN